MFKAIKDQRGIAHIALVIGILIFVAVAGLVIWRVSDPYADFNPLEAFESYPDCAIEDKKICKFLSLWTGGIDYRVTGTQTENNETTNLLYELSNNGTRYHAKVEKDGVTYEITGIDNVLYVKNQSSDKWYKKVTDTSDSSTGQYDMLSDFSDEVNKTKNGTDTSIEYKRVGIEKCGDLACYKYQVVNTKNTSATQFMWFDNKDYKLRKLTTETSSGSGSTQEFSYDNVSIEAPANVEEIIQN